MIISAVHIGPIYPWYSNMMPASPANARFLGPGTTERMFTGAVRLMCRFDSDASLFQPKSPESVGIVLLSILRLLLS